MGTITIIKEIKSIHPDYIALVKRGGFYRVYGKDAYIISKLFKYKIKKEENVVTSGFPIKTINKVVANLQNKKINYLILDSRDNYNISEKVDFKNLNTYSKMYESSKLYVNNQMSIDEICNYLLENAEKAKLKQVIEGIRAVINEKGTI